ncbi:MAG: 30S ribosome-binding factor RbfA [bacterium]
MKSIRLEKINSLLREEIGNIIQRDLKDPRVGFVSVLEVKTSPDLREAKVFVSVFADEEKQKKTIKGLKNAAGFIHHEIKERLNLRHIPHIIFELDNSVENGSRILELMEKISRGEEISSE